MIKIYLLLFITFAAACIGAICGLGSGLLVKPTLAYLNIFSNPEITTFLSGCSVLAMTSYSIIKNIYNNKVSKNKTSNNLHPVMLLIISAALGGIIGKSLFHTIQHLISNFKMINIIQTLILLVLTIITLIYLHYRNKIKSLNLSNKFLEILVGIGLGLISGLIGVGGGPINLMALFLLFGMSNKRASINSLYIAFFSQLTSVSYSLFHGILTIVSAKFIFLMCIGGLLGGIVGRYLALKLSDETTNKILKALLWIIIIINIANLFKFS